MGECYKMDIMKYNDYSIKSLKGKNLYIVVDNHGKICYYNKDVNKCINFINKENIND